MSDLIDRQATIDAVDSTDWYHINSKGEMVSGANSNEHQPWYKADDIYKVLEELPSAQPEIIRCKECIRHGGCRYEQLLGLNGYCSQAERRTDGTLN